MAVNKSKGNMYKFVTHTWNTVKGACFHDCSYCYMKKWGRLNPIRFDKTELRTDLGQDRFIFVGSSNDLFAEQIPAAWILDTLEHCAQYPNKYLFQSKNPRRFLGFHEILKKIDANICTTLETNRHIPDIMRQAPIPDHRARAMVELGKRYNFPLYVTIEPVMDFDIDDFLQMLVDIDPVQVNIGADSMGSGLPEPDPDKIKGLVTGLVLHGIKVNPKTNIRRIVPVEELITSYQIVNKASGAKITERKFTSLSYAKDYIESLPGEWIDVTTFGDPLTMMNKTTYIELEVIIV